MDDVIQAGTVTKPRQRMFSTPASQGALCGALAGLLLSVVSVNHHADGLNNLEKRWHIVEQSAYSASYSGQEHVYYWSYFRHPMSMIASLTPDMVMLYVVIGWIPAILIALPGLRSGAGWRSPLGWLRRMALVIFVSGFFLPALGTWCYRSYPRPLDPIVFDWYSLLILFSGASLAGLCSLPSTAISRDQRLLAWLAGLTSAGVIAVLSALFVKDVVHNPYLHPCELATLALGLPIMGFVTWGLMDWFASPPVSKPPPAWRIALYRKVNNMMRV